MLELSENELLAWLNEPLIEDELLEDAHDFYLLQLPRIVFLKNLPKNSTILDIGSGDGSLIIFKKWLGVLRPDLKFVGISLAHGTHTHEYDEFHICNVDSERPDFQNRPTNVIGCQFIEHTENPQEILSWLFDTLPSGGTVFLDWPSVHTTELPKRDAFIRRGFDVTTLNFFDDATHVRAYGLEEIVKMGKSAGFDVIAQGMVDMPFLADKLRDMGKAQKNSYLLSMSMWLKTNFVSYCSFRKT